MGRTAKFSEDLLLDAVIQYSDFCKTKIKATELAEWARNNITGLEDVNDYHFTRPIKNPETKKQEKRLCTQRLEEINTARDIRKQENRNVLLSSVNIDRFYELSEREQRNEISKAREIVSKYHSSNAYYKKKYDIMNQILSEYAQKVSELEEKLRTITKKQSFIDRKISALLKDNDEKAIRNKLKEIGITDGDFDLKKYQNSLRLEVEEMFNIEKVIRQYQRSLGDNDDTDEISENTVNVKDDYIDDLTDF